jgi:hypothetical protein
MHSVRSPFLGVCKKGARPDALGHVGAKRLLLIILIGLAWLVAGCSRSTATLTPTPPEASSTPLPTAVPLPSPTPTPELPLAVLLAPPGADSDLAGAMQAKLGGLAEKAGLRFQVRSALSAGELATGVRLVVALPPDPGLAGLAAAAPDVQFLALEIPGLQPATNLSVIGGQGERPDQRGFLAGYIAAAITTDWRVGALGSKDIPAGKAALGGFTNGVYYFCGLCRTVYPPFPASGYPLTFSLPEGAGAADWQAAVVYFQAWQVQTIYVDPSVAGPDLLQFLTGEGFNLIGTGMPPAGLEKQWVASLDKGDAIQLVDQLWPRLLAREGGDSLDPPLSIQHINPDLLSPGRQHLSEKMLAELLAGYIDTGVDPVSGEQK